MTGHKLLHYQIIEKLGEGGMGVVYKARDTHLDRFVAIKVLPPERVADPSRKARFVQEAKTASALNHPNIITIHDISTEDGVDFIAMEYVDGRTLDQIIPRKGMRLNDALKIAIQVADALARAHAAGIVHRDLKPANIMVDSHGQVKVLDFGLAKLTEVTTDDRTVTMKTEEGAILGTAAYMSPEQAEGRPVDARSDIFSLGAVLYEMVTGQRAFQGDSTISILASILHKDPPELGAGIPRDLHRLIALCLRKNPAKRSHHMADIRLAMEDLKTELDSGALAAAEAKSPEGKRRARIAPWAVACSALALVALIWMRPWVERPAVALKVVPLTTDSGQELYPSLSPDGSQVVYSWKAERSTQFDLQIQQVGGEDRRLLTMGAEDDYSPAWSPDGRTIAFLRASSDGSTKLILTSPLGARERVLAEGMFPRLDVSMLFPHHLGWTPDSSGLAAVTRESESDKWSVRLFSWSTREWRTLTSPPSPGIADASPSFSPDGRRLAFRRVQSMTAADIYVLDLTADLQPAGEPRRLTAATRYAQSPVWTPDGSEVLFLDGSSWMDVRLWRVPADGSAPPRSVQYLGEYVHCLSLSRSGKQLVFQRSSPDSNLWQLQLSGPGKRSSDPKPLPSSTLIESYPSHSPDGTRFSFASNRTGNYELYVVDSSGKNAAAMTNLHASYVGWQSWAPDGNQIAFVAAPTGQRDIYVIDAAGGRQPRLIVNHPNDDIMPAWSRDGQSIYFGSNRTGEFQVWKVDARGGTAIPVTTKGGYSGFESPDGTAFYFTQATASAGLWRVPAAGKEPELVFEPLHRSNRAVHLEGLYFVRQEAAGNSLLFRDWAGRFATLLTGQPDFIGLSVAPDGRSIVYARRDRENTDLMLVENFK